MATKTLTRSMSTDELREALTFCLVQLQQQCSQQQLSQALTTLLKVFRNVQQFPHEQKYRSLKTENKAFHDRAWQYPTVQQFLLATGWAEVDGVVMLLEDQFVDTAVQVLQRMAGDVCPATVTTSAPTVPAPAAPSPQSEKERLLAETRKRQYEAARKDKEERRRIAEQIRADRRETSTRESRDSIARHVNTGSHMTRFDDIGIDLNKGGG